MQEDEKTAADLRKVQAELDMLKADYANLEVWHYAKAQAQPSTMEEPAAIVAMPTATVGAAATPAPGDSSIPCSRQAKLAIQKINQKNRRAHAAQGDVPREGSCAVAGDAWCGRHMSRSASKGASLLLRVVFTTKCSEMTRPSCSGMLPRCQVIIRTRYWVGRSALSKVGARRPC